MNRIVFVIDYLSMKTGGPRFLFEVMRNLARKSYEVHIVTGSVDETIQYTDSGINIINLDIYQQTLPPSAQPTNSIIFFKKAVDAIKKVTNNGAPYILHLNSHFPNLISYIARIDAPIVCTIHHLEETTQFPGVIPKIAKVIIQDVFEVNSPCTIIHVPSNSTKQKVMSHSIVNRDNVVVIPPGIETKRYLSIPRKPENGFFVMIGRLEKRKHYEHAIAAFKLVKKLKPEYKLYIVGDGPLRSYLQHLVSRFDLKDNVFLLGAVDEETKLNLLSRATALIHLGYPEGFGIVIIEALAAGVPVIAYDVPPLNELVRHRVIGVLVRKNSIAQLAKEIAKFDKYSFNEEGLRRIAKSYDINKIAEKFHMLYSIFLGFDR